MDRIEIMQQARRLRARLLGEMARAALAALAAGYYRLVAAARSRRMRDEMHRQSDHLLRDIGLRRVQIDLLFR